MLRVATDLPMAPSDGAPVPGLVATAACGSQPTFHVTPYAAGDISAPVSAPTGAVALRYPFGTCRIWAWTDGDWVVRGEAAAGHVHVAAPGNAVRTEWLSDGEEIVLIVPHDYWREQVTQRMRDLMTRGRPRRHRDAVLLQLGRLLVRATTDNVQGVIAAPLVEAMLMRGVMLCADARVRTPAERRHQALPAHRMTRIRDYVKHNLSGPMTLGDMADAVGLSPMHFAAQFRAATGKRPHDYLLEQRIHRAKELIGHTRHSLYDVALAVGFNTQAHFCTVFKRITGTTPRQWRDDVQACAA